MKRLILMRHAKAAPPRGGGDFQRVLAERGRLAAPRVGGFLKSAGLAPDLVLVSSAARTRETYDLTAPAAGLAPPQFHDDLYLAPPETLLGHIRRAPRKTNTLMIIAHNPGVAELTLFLADEAESDPAALRRATLKFPTATVAVLDVLTPWSEVQAGDCALRRFVTPSDLGGVDED